MAKRTPISKRVRFEVFKRDKFTCQYCGEKAPDVVLHLDHIKPVAKGGTNEILNLVCACAGCNGGKSDKLLDDSSVIEKQRAQIEELSARREQLEMMMSWRDEVQKIKTDTVEFIAQKIEERGHFHPSSCGKAEIRKWLKKYDFDEVLNAVDEAFDIYMEWDNGKPTKNGWPSAFIKIPGICSVSRQSVEKPYLRKLFYIQGILRNRFDDRRGLYIADLERMIVVDGVLVEELERLAKETNNWDHFCQFAFYESKMVREGVKHGAD